MGLFRTGLNRIYSLEISIALTLPPQERESLFPALGNTP
jgi:hypothetical protein